MPSTPHPSATLLENAEALISVFREVNLYDAEIITVHLSLSPARAALIDVDLAMPGWWAGGVPATVRAPAYRATLRCSDIEDLVLGDFRYQNVVGDYGFEVIAPRGPTDHPAPDGRDVRVWVTGGPGCSIDVRCRSVRVHAVVPAIDAPAV
jgi:hypothetical protein